MEVSSSDSDDEEYIPEGLKLLLYATVAMGTNITGVYLQGLFRSSDHHFKHIFSI